MLDIALQEQLGLLAIGWGGQGDHAEDARTDFFRHCLDRAALAGGIAALEQDDDAELLFLHPLLQVTELDLQLA